MKDRKNQLPVRDRALFLALLFTGLRVSELLGLDRRQYVDKHFLDVKRKGKVRTRKVTVPTEARDALAVYLKERGDQAGPLFLSKSGGRLARQHVDRLLKQVAAQANSKINDEGKKIHLAAHVLRHTFLRQVATKHGVRVAMEVSGHSTDRYIWRYVKPSDEEKDKAMEGLF